ncbi:MAG: hypothetical protein Q9216_003311 [Gyalolechia sp. 2 TL-2023]
MKPSIVKHLLVAASVLKGVAKKASATPIKDVRLAPHYDYEPGDQLKRTMCFCTSDTSLAQTDNDPEAFYNTTEGHRMAYYYEFEYYNHRLDKHLLVSSPGNSCLTHDSTEDPYYHNDCIAWEDQEKDYCADFHLDGLPAGVSDQYFWRFCYLFRGDELDDPAKRDFFTFDGGKRAIPRARDWMKGKEEVKDICGGMCEEKLGMKLFESRFGGWFNRVDGFHHFDDICTKNMNCANGPGHHGEKPSNMKDEEGGATAGVNVLSHKNQQQQQVKGI